MSKIDKNQFERMFGIRPQPALTKMQKERAANLNRLFDSMRDELGITSQEVFRGHADRLHGAFIRNILDCPEVIEDYCKEALRPESEARTRHALVLHMKNEKGRS